MSRKLNFVNCVASCVCVMGVMSLSPLVAAQTKLKTVVPGKAKSPNQDEAVLSPDNSVSVQDQGASSRPVKGALGVLDFSLLLPPGWSESAGSRAKVALQSDGNDLLPTFSYESAGGGVIYGTWRTFREGQIFSAETIGGGIPAFSSDWGINKGDVFNKVATVGNLEYAVLIASGPGDGLAFSVGGKRRMTAVWVDIPVAYKDKVAVQSGLASVYYRGPVEGYAQGKALIDALMESLNPNQVSLMTVGEFRSLYAAKPTAATPAATPAPKAAVTTSSANSKEMKLSERVGDLERDAERLLRSIQELKKSLP
jgi:hypothetical protein